MDQCPPPRFAPGFQFGISYAPDDDAPTGTQTRNGAGNCRGGCAFEIKAANAQAAGAVAAIIGNVASSGDPGTAPGMAEADRNVIGVSAG